MMQGSVVLLSEDGVSCTFVVICCKIMLDFFHATHCALQTTCHETVLISVAELAKSPQHPGLRG